MSIIYLSAWIIEFGPNYFWWTTFLGWFGLGLAHFILIMANLCFYLAASTDPGLPPSNYIPPNATEEELEKAKQKPKVHIRNRYADTVVWCRKCNNFKPPRTHHCKCCGRCVLKMDHHCAWLNQCVGYFNHKFFIQWLFYVNLGFIFLIFLLVHRIVDQFFGWSDLPSISNFEGLVIFVDLLLLVFVFPATILMIGQHLTLIARSVTMIELWTRHWADYDMKEKGLMYKYPYDKGSYMENLREFFGESTLSWFIPIAPTGNGYSYPHLMIHTKQNFKTFEQV